MSFLPSTMPCSRLATLTLRHFWKNWYTIVKWQPILPMVFTVLPKRVFQCSKFFNPKLIFGKNNENCELRSLTASSSSIQCVILCMRVWAFAEPPEIVASIWKLFFIPGLNYVCFFEEILSTNWREISTLTYFGWIVSKITLLIFPRGIPLHSICTQLTKWKNSRWLNNIDCMFQSKQITNNAIG